MDLSNLGAFMIGDAESTSIVRRFTWTLRRLKLNKSYFGLSLIRRDEVLAQYLYIESKNNLFSSKKKLREHVKKTGSAMVIFEH